MYLIGMANIGIEMQVFILQRFNLIIGETEGCHQLQL